MLIDNLKINDMNNIQILIYFRYWIDDCGGLFKTIEQKIIFILLLFDDRHISVRKKWLVPTQENFYSYNDSISNKAIEERVKKWKIPKWSKRLKTYDVNLQQAISIYSQARNRSDYYDNFNGNWNIDIDSYKKHLLKALGPKSKLYKSIKKIGRKYKTAA